eukprot:COSAG01_NODE_2105_length_8423_cov_6.483409_3_plen_297_part_00
MNGRVMIWQVHVRCAAPAACRRRRARGCTCHRIYTRGGGADLSQRALEISICLDQSRCDTGVSQSHAAGRCCQLSAAGRSASVGAMRGAGSQRSADWLPSTVQKGSQRGRGPLRHIVGLAVHHLQQLIEAPEAVEARHPDLRPGDNFVIRTGVAHANLSHILWANPRHVWAKLSHNIWANLQSWRIGHRGRPPMSPRWRSAPSSCRTPARRCAPCWRARLLRRYCNVIEAPWLVNGGHGASLRPHKHHSAARPARRQRPPPRRAALNAPFGRFSAQAEGVQLAAGDDTGESQSACT